MSKRIRMCSSLRSDLRSLAGFLLEMKAALSSPNMGSLAAFAFREGNQPCEKVVCVFFLCVCRGASVAHKTHPLCDRRRCRGGRYKPWKASSFYVIHLYDLLKANEILEGTTRGFNNSPFLYETLCRGSGSGGHC